MGHGGDVSRNERLGSCSRDMFVYLVFITVTRDLSQERELVETQQSQKDEKEEKVLYQRTSATTKKHTSPVPKSVSQIRDVTIVTKNSSGVLPPPPPPVSNECKLLMVNVNGF